MSAPNVRCASIAVTIVSGRPTRALTLTCGHILVYRLPASGTVPASAPCRCCEGTSNRARGAIRAWDEFHGLKPANRLRGSA